MESHYYSDNIKKIDYMVSEIKKESGITVKYMRMWEERREILLEGIAQGKEEGIIEGKIEGKAAAIIELLAEAGSGSVPEELQKRIMEQTEQTILSKWLKLAAKSSSIEEFCRNMDI